MSAEHNKLWLNGHYVAVSEEVYAAYTQGERKMRYFEEDLKTERIILDEEGRISEVIPSREDSLDRLMEENAMQFPDQRENVSSSVLHHVTNEHLYKALGALPDEDRQLIQALFFDGKTERAVAEALGISQQAVNSRKHRIFEKLKIFLKKFDF